MLNQKVMINQKVMCNTVIGTLLAIGILAGSFGQAGVAQADDAAPSTNTDTSVIEPLHMFPLLPALDPGCRRQLFYFNGRWHCG
jgi:hypothetical protein